MTWRALSHCLLVLLAGCAATGSSLKDVFPPGSVAAPWVLQDEVWTGSFEEASDGLGADAATWQAFGPQHVWLAVYTHEEGANRCLKVRCFALGSSQEARRAFAKLQPAEAAAFQYGDTGCWVEGGVLLQWGRLVIEIFGPDTSWGSQAHSALLAGFIAKRMPPELPENPR